MELYCDLDCCFRMFRHPENSTFLSEVFLGDDAEIAPEYSVCAATREEWEKEVDNDQLNQFNDEGYIGGVPYDCPIYQGAVWPWDAVE